MTNTLLNAEAAQKPTAYKLSDYDMGILAERNRARNALSGPRYGSKMFNSRDGVRIGDIVERISPDGVKEVARITHIWGPFTTDENGVELPVSKQYSIQTTVWVREPLSIDNIGSFYLSGSGTLNYSGGMESGLPLTRFKHVGRSTAKCWFFSRDNHTAHNGVDARVDVNVFKLCDDSEIVDYTKEGRYLLNMKASEIEAKFTGSCQTATYFTMDGVERVSYSGNLPLTDYLQANDPNNPILSIATLAAIETPVISEPTNTFATTAPLSGNLHPLPFDAPILQPIDYQEPDYRFTVVNSDQFTKLLDWHEKRSCTGLELITIERYDEMLNELPPCRWGNIERGGKKVEYFHISERLNGNLVNWFFLVKDSQGERAFTKVDLHTMSKEQIFELAAEM